MKKSRMPAKPERIDIPVREMMVLMLPTDSSSVVIVIKIKRKGILSEKSMLVGTEMLKYVELSSEIR